MYHDPVYRLPPKPVELPIPEVPRKLSDFDLEINADFKENSPFQEGMFSEMYQRQDRSYFQGPQELDSLINTGKLVQKFLPKQADIDKSIKDNTKKSSKRNAFTHDCEGNTGRIFNQPMF